MNRVQKAAYQELQRLSTSGGSLGEIAAALASLKLMIIPSVDFSAEGTAERDENPAAFGTSEDFKPLVRTTLDGERFVCVFTSEELARAYGSETPQESVNAYRPSGWPAGIYEFLIRNYDGIIVDPGSPHALTLSRTQAAYVYALLNADNMLRRNSLHLISRGEQTFLQEANQRVIAYTYESYLAASAGVEWLSNALNDSRIELAVQERSTVDVLSEIIAAGAEIMLVNAGLPDQHMYYQDDLKRFLASLGRPVDIMSADNLRVEEDEEPELLTKARQRSQPELKKQDFPSDVAVSNHLIKLRSLIEQGELPPWKFLEELAGCALYVPVLPQRTYGLSWPTFWRSRKGGSFTAVCFARRADMDKEFSDTSSDYRYHRLVGLEALRWIVATPAPFDSISIDVGDDRDWLEFPAWWGLLPMLPLLAEDSDELPGSDGSPEWKVVEAAAAQSSSSRPTFKEIASTASAMLRSGEINEATAGKLAALIPRYWVCKQLQPDNLDGTPLRDEQSGRIVLFTDQVDAEQYVEKHLGSEQRQKTRIFPVLSGWENSALHLGEDEEAEICINPGESALILKQDSLSAALDKLSELLMPRVPEFVET